MILFLTSSYSGLLSLAAHCSKMLKKNYLFNVSRVSLFHFFSHAPRFLPFSRYLFLPFPHFLFWFSSLPHLRPVSSLVFFFFYFLRSPSTKAAASFLSTHAAKPICASLLPLIEPTITNTTSSLLPLTKPTITNPRILSLIEPTIVNPIAYLLPLIEPTLLSLSEPKNPVLKPIFSSQNRRFKGWN